MTTAIEDTNIWPDDETVYCAVDGCEAEASFVIDKTSTPLCSVCHDVFTWGATNVEGKVREAVPSPEGILSDALYSFVRFSEPDKMTPTEKFEAISNAAKNDDPDMPKGMRPIEDFEFHSPDEILELIGGRVDYLNGLYAPILAAL